MISSNNSTGRIRAKVSLVQKALNGTPAPLNLATPATILAFSQNQGNFRPVHRVMAEAKEKFDGKAIAPELRVRVADDKGNLVALPLAMSTPVLYKQGPPSRRRPRSE